MIGRRRKERRKDGKTENRERSVYNRKKHGSREGERESGRERRKRSGDGDGDGAEKAEAETETEAREVYQIE